MSDGFAFASTFGACDGIALTSGFAVGALLADGLPPGFGMADGDALTPGLTVGMLLAAGLPVGVGTADGLTVGAALGVGGSSAVAANSYRTREFPSASRVTGTFCPFIVTYSCVFLWKTVAACFWPTVN